jgi:hypothetical protein
MNPQPKALRLADELVEFHGPTKDNASYAAQQAAAELRDYFAAKAMQALAQKYSHEGDISRNAYKIADAMLKAREA